MCFFFSKRVVVRCRIQILHFSVISYTFDFKCCYDCQRVNAQYIYRTNKVNEPYRMTTCLQYIVVKEEETMSSNLLVYSNAARVCWRRLFSLEAELWWWSSANVIPLISWSTEELEVTVDSWLSNLVRAESRWLDEALDEIGVQAADWNIRFEPLVLVWNIRPFPLKMTQYRLERKSCLYKKWIKRCKWSATPIWVKCVGAICDGEDWNQRCREPLMIVVCKTCIDVTQFFVLYIITVALLVDWRKIAYLSVQT